MKRKKSKPWFVKVRGSYLPASWQGWVAYLPFTVFLVAVLFDAFRTQTSPQAIFYLVFPQWVAAAVVMTWLASRKSQS